MRKIKILYIIPFLGYGGTEKQLEILIKNIDRDVVTPFIVTLYGDDIEVGKRCNCKSLHLNMKSLMSFEGIGKIFKVVKFSKDNEIDLVYSFFLDPSVIALFVKIFNPKVVFVTARRDLGFWMTPFKKMVFSFINIFTDAVIANSGAVKAVVEKNELFLKGKVRILYNGVYLPYSDEIEKFRIKKRRELGLGHSFIIGIVGNFNRRVKRYDLFIESASMISKKIPNADFKFLIVGRGELKGELEMLIEKYGIRDKVIFPGSVENPFPYIASFDVALNVSDSEGFSNAVLEYMASSVPVVVTDNPGNTELVRDGITGLVAKCGDANDVAEKVLRLFCDENLRRKLGSRGREEVVAFYSMGNMFENNKRLLLELVNKG